MKVSTDACLFGAWVAAELIKDAGNSKKSLLDIGTGTGLLSLMVAQKNNVRVDAIEIDAATAAQAAENVAASSWQNYISIINEDVLLLTSDKKYDIILSNPPFYENDLPSADQLKNTAHHSTQLTLNNLFTVISRKLTNEGTCFILLPFKRLQEATELFKKKGLYISNQIIVKQSVNHLPFRVLLRAGYNHVPTLIEEIAIWNETQQYTPAFTELLKDYYLYL
jgi:tRNA1Val (adenine37-N6)-methyltransferase